MEFVAKKRTSIVWRVSTMFLLSTFVTAAALTFADPYDAGLILLGAAPIIAIVVLLFFEAFDDT